MSDAEKDWKEILEEAIEDLDSTYIDWELIIGIFTELEIAGCGSNNLTEFSNYLHRKYKGAGLNDY